MTKYRVYALIHGQTLPLGKLFDCEIQFMKYDEQLERVFEPIKSSDFQISFFEHKTYVSNTPYIDPKIVRSEHVLVTCMEEVSPNGALGCAAKRFEKVCRFLSLANLEDIKRKYGRNRGTFEPYLYQINKIYELDTQALEHTIDYKLQGFRLYLPNRPERTGWMDITLADFLQETYNFYDDVLHKAVKYLYSASMGTFENRSPEKISLDHFKSIEVIISELSNKRVFKDKVDEAREKLELTEEEVDEIKNLWDQRSKYGDLAHSKVVDRSEMLPNQFPIPSDVEYLGGFLDTLAPNIILKYFYYKKNLFTVDVEITTDESDCSECLIAVHTQTNLGFAHENYYHYRTKEQDDQKLSNHIKKIFALKLKIYDDKVIKMEGSKKGLKYKYVRRFKSGI